jgi:hypothetical protein
MSIEKIAELLELPKALVQGAQAFLDRLLGPAVDETGQLLADKVRYRRFKNQVKIIADAQTVLAHAGLEPIPIPLRTLVPLVEKASLEEEPGLQKMWSNLLANAATSDSKEELHRLCVDVLSSISPREALMLQHAYGEYQRKRPELLAKLKKWRSTREEIYADSLFFRPAELLSRATLPETEGDVLLDNLLRLNLFRYEVPEIEDGQNVSPRFVHLTELGLAVLKECQEPPSSPTRG